MRTGSRSNPRISDAFQQVSAANQEVGEGKKVTPSPFSLRLSAKERAWLEERAGNRPLGAYIRERLLGEREQKRRRFRKPRIDDKLAAQLLAELGRSRLASNLNQLSRAVNMGTLDVSRDVERELREACGTVKIMGDVLMQVFGVLPGRER